MGGNRLYVMRVVQGSDQLEVYIVWPSAIANGVVTGLANMCLHTVGKRGKAGHKLRESPVG